MMNCKFTVFSIVLSLTVFIANLLFAGEIKIDNYPVLTDPAFSDLNSEVRVRTDELLEKTNKDSRIRSAGNFNRHVKAFIDSNSMAYSAGNMYSITDMKLFCISVGAAGGMSDVESGEEKYFDRDKYSGDRFGMTYGNLYIRNSDITILQLRGSNITPIRDSKGSYISSSSFGAGLLYKLNNEIPTDYYVKIRPICLYTGIFYVSNATYNRDYASVTKTVESGNAVYEMNTDLSYKVKTTSLVFPIEIVCDFNIIWVFNIFAGAGVDLSYGWGYINTYADSSMKITRENKTTTVAGQDNFHMDKRTNSKTSFHTMPKIIYGYGIDLKYLKMDALVSIYANKNFSMMISFGVVY